jgi:transcription initiation factor TFIIIB Brf1 subunit/transcription initiation factor TFIIB
MIVEEAKIIFFKISNLVSARRTKLTSLMATSVIIAHKIKGYDKDMNEIAKIFALDVRILRKMVKDYERIWKEIQEKEDAEQTTLASDSIISSSITSNPVTVPSTNVTQHEQIVITVDDNKKLRKYLVELGVESIYFDDIFKINNWVQERNLLISHIPKSRYACLIYLLDQIYELGVNKSTIITACDTSNVTINKCFNKLVPYYDEIKTLLS